jgi:hypothetical protein
MNREVDRRPASGSLLLTKAPGMSDGKLKEVRCPESANVLVTSGVPPRSDFVQFDVLSPGETDR